MGSFHSILTNNKQNQTIASCGKSCRASGDRLDLGKHSLIGRSAAICTLLLAPTHANLPVVTLYDADTLLLACRMTQRLSLEPENQGSQSLCGVHSSYNPPTPQVFHLFSSLLFLFSSHPLFFHPSPSSTKPFLSEAMAVIPSEYFFSCSSFASSSFLVTLCPRSDNLPLHLFPFAALFPVDSFLFHLSFASPQFSSSFLTFCAGLLPDLISTLLPPLCLSCHPLLSVPYFVFLRQGLLLRQLR